MKQIIRSLTVAVVGLLLMLPGLAQQRDDKPKSKEAALQQQIDELKAGQQQILKEVQEIKAAPEPAAA